MISKKIQKLIVKYLIKQASSSELDELDLWLKEPENEKEFVKYVKTNYSIDFNLKNFNSNLVKKNISELIRNEKKLFRIRKVKKYMKFAAVFCGILVSSYLIKNNLFNIPTEAEPLIVNTIQSGTDKATLTLADGSQVILEKGLSLKTKNANSNGEEIIYQSNQKIASKISYNYLTIPRGGQFFIKLSDGTQVWLNSESQLKYPVQFIEGQSRKVELVYGEAYFDVSPSTKHHGADFKVYSNKQEVRVLGTEFNLKAYKNESDIYTTLVEGKVLVDIDNKKQYLVPNQQSKFNLNTGRIEVSEVDIYNTISWKNGIFSFDDKSLKEIMKVLSRWYDMEVIFESTAIENEKFIGQLSKDQDIKDVLLVIKKSGVIKDYEFKGKILIIK